MFGISWALFVTFKASMPTVYLALGANLGNRPANLRAVVL